MAYGNVNVPGVGGQELEEVRSVANNAETNTATNNTASKTGILSQKLSYIISTLIGATNNTGGSATAGTVMAKLNGIFTNASTAATKETAAATDAAAAKANTAANNTASATGTLSQKLSYIISTLIGATNSTGGSATAGTAMAKLNAIFSKADNTYTQALNGNTKATTIKTNTDTNNTASKTGVLSQKLAYVIGLLENTTYGLSALKTAVTGGSAVAKGVKSISRYMFSTSSYKTTEDIAISTVNPARCMVLVEHLDSFEYGYDYTLSANKLTVSHRDFTGGVL